jgi:protein-arginine kinase
MKLKTLEKLSRAMKEIAPAIEKMGFVITGIADESNSSWDNISIHILPIPEPGSTGEKILQGEGFKI